MTIINNIINSPTSSTGWTSFTTTITSTGTSPTQGAGAIKESYYLQQGKILNIYVKYYQTAAGTAGTGEYRFNIPSGFTIDTAMTGTSATFALIPSIGFGVIHIPTVALGFAFPNVADSTIYGVLCSISSTTIILPMSASTYAFSNTDLLFTWNMQVLIT